MKYYGTTCSCCGGIFNYDIDQIRATCPSCGAVQTTEPPVDISSVKDRMCGDKRRFLNKETADIVRVGYETQHQCEMNIYKCEFCGYWHIGHKPRRGKPATIIADYTEIKTIDDSMTYEDTILELAMLKTRNCELQQKVAGSQCVRSAEKSRSLASIQSNALRSAVLRARLIPLKKEHKAKQLAAAPERDQELEELIATFKGAYREILRRLNDREVCPKCGHLKQ